MHQSHFTYAIYTAGFDYFSMFLKTTLLSWLRYCYHRCEKNDENDGLLYSKHGWMSFRKHSCYHSSFWVYIVTRFISLFFLNCCLLLLFESFFFFMRHQTRKTFFRQANVSNKLHSTIYRKRAIKNYAIILISRKLNSIFKELFFYRLTNNIVTRNNFFNT